jgi:hypothetical protein
MNLLLQMFFIIAVTGIVFTVLGLIEKVIARREQRNRFIKDKPKSDTRSSIELHQRILARE